MIAEEVMAPFIGTEIPREKLRGILQDALNFPIPLVTLSERVSVLELFHGPTLAFKDVGARVLARLLAYFEGNSAQYNPSQNTKPITVIVATSGDTGGAVGSGFFGVPGTRVVIFFPKGKISAIQQAQITSFSKNIHTIEVEGTFDDCQALVKRCLTDNGLREKIPLTSANSINFGRLLPQAVYFFWAYAQFLRKQRQIRNGGSEEVPRVCFIVPSGNLGNLTAGLIACTMGLPVDIFLGACNINDSLPRFIESGKFNPLSSISTVSNAMDVGNPNNFSRVIALQNILSSGSNAPLLLGNTATDEETLETMRKVYRSHRYILDPHGAVGFFAAEKLLSDNPCISTIILHTAHPAKFGDIVERALSHHVTLPSALAECINLSKTPKTIAADYNSVVEILEQLP
jgi:threonine synthase